MRWLTTPKVPAETLERVERARFERYRNIRFEPDPAIEKQRQKAKRSETTPAHGGSIV